MFSLDVDYVLPKYDGESLLNVIGTIEKFWGMNPLVPPLSSKFSPHKLDGCSQLIFFLVDGMGMNLLKPDTNGSFFSFLLSSSKLNTITSVFPSSTVSALSSIHTGLSPRTHGLLDWYLYFDEINKVIKPFTGETVRADSNITNVSIMKGNVLFKGTSIYQRLKKIKVESLVFYPQEYINSYYSHNLMKGSKKIAYKNLNDLMNLLVPIVNENRKNRYFFVYISSLDKLEHKYGPKSVKVKNNLRKIESFFIKFSTSVYTSIAKKSGIIITADHGLIKTSPKKILLFAEEDLRNKLQMTNADNIIFPSGNQRDLFLSIKKGELAVFQKNINKKLTAIKLTDTVLDILLGNFPNHPTLHYRTGNLLLLPKGDGLVWYKYLDKRKFTSLGKHGGLSKDEMLIPLILDRLSNLVYH